MSRKHIVVGLIVLLVGISQFSLSRNTPATGSNHIGPVEESTTIESGEPVTVVYAASDLLPADGDFTQIISDIKENVSPSTWDEVGGEGSIAGFPTNRSLVVRQSKPVHEKLVSYLTGRRN